ncbi:hypothetical protein HQ587_10490 [bacterium]|nr:hypothetical protein [bacterium]
MIPDYENHPVSFVSINTRNPEGQVDAELKKFRKKYKYELNFPIFYGRRRNINKDFKVEKLPRLVLVRADTTVFKDVLFMKEMELREAIDMLLREIPETAEDSVGYSTE